MPLYILNVWQCCRGLVLPHDELHLHLHHAPLVLWPSQQAGLFSPPDHQPAAAADAPRWEYPHPRSIQVVGLGLGLKGASEVRYPENGTLESRPGPRHKILCYHPKPKTDLWTCLQKQDSADSLPWPKMHNIAPVRHPDVQLFAGRIRSYNFGW